MNRDFFVDKVLRGEPVALVDVVKSNAESELEAIYSEAESKRAAQDARLEAETHREAALSRLLTLDSEAEQLNADLLALRDERAAMTQAFDEKESVINEAVRQKRGEFDLHARLFTDGEPFDVRNPKVLRVVAWLRSQGAKINALGF